MNDREQLVAIIRRSLGEQGGDYLDDQDDLDALAEGLADAILEAGWPAR